MSEHNYHIAAEADLNPKINRHIWGYFIGFGIMLTLILVGLTIMYRFQLEYELWRKVGLVNTEESLEYTRSSQAYMSGQKGLFEGKRHVAIDVAMKHYLTELRKGD